ncbi:MAG: iron ABC transporter permease [Rhodothermales bacterium]|nr:iron ABC transporter permease [Rhodothermales bacterium]
MSRATGIGIGLLAALAASVGVATAFGSADVTVAEVGRVVLDRLGLAAGPSETAGIIVWELRLPRVLLAAAVGGGLSVVGVAMQALVRNPLAEPYLLGVSSGASAGAALFYLGFLPPLVSRALSLPLAAFLGALAAIVLVVLVARQGSRLPTARLLLAGVALSALLASVTAFVTYASPDPGKLRAVLFWLLGSFAGAGWERVALPAAASLLGLGMLWALARPLDALLTGEEPAESLGVPVEALKRVLVGLAALVTGLLVAASGVIGFVGLIVPHAVRFGVGVGHRRVVPLAFLAGAVFLVWADLAARTVLPDQELPVGVLTALCGVPFFLVLLRRLGPVG